mgnify:CR=1 FL=1
MNLERKYNEEEEKAINISREMAGLPPITQDNENITVENKEVKNEAATIEAIATEETAEEVKKRRNESERRRIKQQGGLRPRQIFKHTLVDWDGKAKDVVCTYPTTRQASKYSKMDFDPVTGKGVLDFGDIVDCFYNDDLLPRFDFEDFPSSEIIGLGVFLSEVVRNPFLK